MLEPTLQLYAKGWGGTDTTLDAYRLLRSVGMYQATWNQARTGEPWSVAGCNGIGTDRSGSPESTLQTHSIGKWYSFELTELVQRWVDGTLPNEGVTVRGASPWSTGQFFFNSAESSAVDLRPKLVITYR